jgi:hypothetical protein
VIRHRPSDGVSKARKCLNDKTFYLV